MSSGRFDYRFAQRRARWCRAAVFISLGVATWTADRAHAGRISEHCTQVFARSYLALNFDLLTPGAGGPLASARDLALRNELRMLGPGWSYRLALRRREVEKGWTMGIGAKLNSAWATHYEFGNSARLWLAAVGEVYRTMEQEFDRDVASMALIGLADNSSNAALTADSGNSLPAILDGTPRFPRTTSAKMLGPFPDLSDNLAFFKRLDQALWPPEREAEEAFVDFSVGRNLLLGLNRLLGQLFTRTRDEVDDKINASLIHEAMTHTDQRRTRMERRDDDSATTWRVTENGQGDGFVWSAGALSYWIVYSPKFLNSQPGGLLFFHVPMSDEDVPDGMPWTLGLYQGAQVFRGGAVALSHANAAELAHKLSVLRAMLERHLLRVKRDYEVARSAR